MHIVVVLLSDSAVVVLVKGKNVTFTYCVINYVIEAVYCRFTI